MLQIPIRKRFRRKKNIQKHENSGLATGAENVQNRQGGNVQVLQIPANLPAKFTRQEDYV